MPRAAGVLSIALVAEEGALWLGMSRYPLFPFQMGLTSGLALALYPSVLSDKDRVSALVSYAKRLDCLRNVVLQVAWCWVTLLITSVLVSSRNPVLFFLMFHRSIF
jgi:hypothetical protein